MKVKKIKPMICGGMAVWLAMQPIFVQGFTVTLPSEIISVKYPDEFQVLIDEVSVCVLEAESELYSETINTLLPEIDHKEKRTCREILKTKEFAHNLNFGVNYKKTQGVDNPTIPSKKQDVLSILEEPLMIEGVSYNYTETLEIAMRLFVNLNTYLDYEYEKLHRENDILDMLYLRIFNMVYELPKIQGHPIFSEFMKDIRDSYLKVRSSDVFKKLVYYAYKTNPDKEMYETLARYWIHIEQGEREGDSTFVPNENHPLYSTTPDLTPPVPDSDQIAFEDLQNIWEEEREETLKDEWTENRGETIVSQSKPVNQEIETIYLVENAKCLKQIKTYVDSKLVSNKKEEADKSEYYRCGVSVESSEVDEVTVEEDLLLLYYRYGGNDSEWKVTKFKLKDDLEEYLFYQDLVNLLIDISIEHGLGSFKDQDRHLFVLNGKPFVLEKYKGSRFIGDINDWLKKIGIPLEFGRSPEKADKPAIGLDDLQ